MIPLLLFLLIKYFSQYIERLIDWSTLFPSEYVQLFLLQCQPVPDFHHFHFRLILYGLKITSPRTKACTQSLHPICVVPFLTQSLYVFLKMNKNTIGWSTVDPNKLYHVPKALRSSTILVKRLVVVLKVSIWKFWKCLFTILDCQIKAAKEYESCYIMQLSYYVLRGLIIFII